MSRFSGPQRRGAMRFHKMRLRKEAKDRARNQKKSDSQSAQALPEDRETT